MALSCMMELAYCFCSVISLSSSVKIDLSVVAEMYCFFNNPVPYDLVHKKNPQAHGDFQQTAVCYSGCLPFHLSF
jgi:hypothetical protein